MKKKISELNQSIMTEKAKKDTYSN